MDKIYCRNNCCYYNDNNNGCNHHNKEYCDKECKLRIRQDGSSILRGRNEKCALNCKNCILKR